MIVMDSPMYDTRVHGGAVCVMARPVPAAFTGARPHATLRMHTSEPHGGIPPEGQRQVAHRVFTGTPAMCVSCLGVP